MTNETIYRGFRIVRTDPVPPIPQWRDHLYTYSHIDYDGPEDRRIGTASSVQACRAAINDRLGRLAVRVVLDSGDGWVTEINTDFAGACDYYFNAGGFEQLDGSISQVAMVIEVGPNGEIVQVVTAEEFSKAGGLPAERAASGGLRPRAGGLGRPSS